MKAHYLSCHECDELLLIPYPHRKGNYHCPVCGALLFRYHPGMVEKIYALTLAALFLLILTNLFPFLSFEVMGKHSEATFSTAFVMLYTQGDYLLALALLMTTLIVPLARLLLYLALLAPLYHWRRFPPFAALMLKTLSAINPWGMLDVFWVAVLVSMVKLLKVGTVIPGISLWAFGALVIIMATIQSLYNDHLLWDLIDRLKGREPDLIRRKR